MHWLSKEIFSRQAFPGFMMLWLYFFPHRCGIFFMGGKSQKISPCRKVAWEEGEASSANRLVSNTTLEKETADFQRLGSMW